MKKRIYLLTSMLVFLCYSFVKNSHRSEQNSLSNSKDFYLDSKNGNDINNGLLPSDSFKTAAYSVVRIEEYRAANPDTYINLNILANSIYKRDPLIIDINNLTVRKYGVGANPMFDGSLELTSFTLNSGNVYEVTTDYSLQIDGNDIVGRPVVFEDGVSLKPVATIVECEALAGSYVIQQGDGTIGTNLTVQFHPSDSANPLSNSKTYTTNQRPCILGKSSVAGIDLDNVNFEGIDAQYSFNATNFVGTARSPNSYVKDCNSNWGTKHNFHFERNTIADGLFAKESEIQGEYGRSATAFVCYSRSATLADWMHYKNCVAIFTQQKEGVKLGTGNTAFLDHHANNNALGKVIYDNCYTYGYFTAVASNSQEAEINNCFFENITGNLLRPSKNMTVKNSFINGVGNTDGMTTSLGYVTSFENSIITKAKYLPVMDGRLELDNCLITEGFKLPNQYDSASFTDQNGLPNYISSYNCAYLFYRFTMCIALGQYEGDYNIFGVNVNGDAEINHKIDGVAVTTLLDWQTQTGQDANSVFMTETQMRNFLISDPFTGDVIVNPNAEVTGADGTIYVGTFSDGTKISEKISNKEYSDRRKWVDANILSIQNLDKNDYEYKVYPNPLKNNYFTISSNNSNLKEISIFNLQGKIVFETSFFEVTRRIKTPNLKKSIYILQIKEQGKIINMKLLFE